MGMRVGLAIPDANFETSPFTWNAWTLVANGAAARRAHVPSLFVIGNGFIGIRGPGEVPECPKVYLNGVFEKMPIDYHEAAHGYAKSSDTRLSVADATGLAITVDGEPVSDTGSLQLDLRRGLLVQLISCGDVRIRIERMASMQRASIVAARVTVHSEGAAAKVRIRSIVTPPPANIATDATDGAPYDPRVGPIFDRSPWIDYEEIQTGTVIGRIDRLCESGFVVTALTCRADATLAASAEPQSVEFFTDYHASRDQGAVELLDQATRALASASEAGFGALAAEQADWFARFWEDAWIALPDAPEAENALRHGLFQIVQAAGRDGAHSIAAKGQSGEGYEGHVFWDAESYVLPVFAYTRPDIARAMLAWRIAGLDAARKNARAMGHRSGALYPWRTIDGGECSSFFPAGSAQYHINADIAYALRLYVEATGDVSILDDGGAEMLAETARVWLQVGFHDPGRGEAFVINSVTGPDEYSALVDNNLYTNLMAAEHLRFAVAAAHEWLGADEAAAMRNAAEKMFLPFDAARDLYAQDDGFFARRIWPFETTPPGDYPLLIHYHPLVIYRHQVAKQADAVLATVMLRDRFDPAMRLRMLDAYEAVTVHDSTLSASAFAISAANAGDAERAYRYWRVSVLTDLSDLFDNSGHGLHMAALAGGWNALALGFGGVRTTGGKLSFAPIEVPRLGRYAFRVRYRGSVVELSVAGAAVAYRLVSGASVELMHGVEPLTLVPGVVVERSL